VSARADGPSGIPWRGGCSPARGSSPAQRAHSPARTPRRRRGHRNFGCRVGEVTAPAHLRPSGPRDIAGTPTVTSARHLSGGPRPLRYRCTPGSHAGQPGRARGLSSVGHQPPQTGQLLALDKSGKDLPRNDMDLQAVGERQTRLPPHLAKSARGAIAAGTARSAAPKPRLGRAG